MSTNASPGEIDEWVDEDETGHSHLASERGSRDGRGGILRQIADRGTLVGVWLVLVVVFGALVPETFLTVANLQNIFGSQTALLVLTLALLLPLNSGDYDLSVAGTLSLSSMVVAWLNVVHGVPIGLAVAVALGAGVLVGVVNGLLIVGLGIDSFVATLGMATLLSGIVLWISDSQTVVGVSSTLVNAVSGTQMLSLPLQFFYGLGLCVFIWYLLEYTAYGRRLLIVGLSKDMARLNGIRVSRVRFSALVWAGAIASLAGVLYAGTLAGATPDAGVSFLLPAFAGAFLGSTAIRPGRFNAWGSFVAVYLLVTGVVGLQLLGVEAFVQELFYGGALIVAVAVASFVRRRSA